MFWVGMCGVGHVMSSSRLAVDLPAAHSAGQYVLKQVLSTVYSIVRFNLGLVREI